MLKINCTKERNGSKTLFGKLIYGVSLSLCVSSLSYADRFNVYVTGGPSFSALKNNSTVRIVDDILVNEYRADGQSRWQPLWGVGVGHTFENIRHRPYNFSVGLTGYFIDLGHVNGTEYPFIDDAMNDTLDYRFHVKSRALLLEGRLFFTCLPWQPFILGGIGNAWNTLNGYTETPTDPNASAATLPMVFDNHTQSSFAYDVGVGIQRQIYEDMARQLRYAVSLDYQYVNFGEGKLGSFPAQTSSDRIKISNIATNAFMLSFIVAAV